MRRSLPILIRLLICSPVTAGCGCAFEPTGHRGHHRCFETQPTMTDMCGRGAKSLTLATSRKGVGQCHTCRERVDTPLLPPPL